jgi:hypothetical protein
MLNSLNSGIENLRVAFLTMVEGVSELCPVRCDDHHKMFGCPVSQARKVLRYSSAMAPRSAAMVRRSRAVPAE